MSKIDTSVPHSARIWNYWLGGKDNYPVDRRAGDAYAEVFPGIVPLAREQRYFLNRAVRFLVAEAGIRQFLDIGTGLPTVDHTHEVAQRLAPESRIVYVDNDPLVLAHATALLTSAPEGATDYLQADAQHPDAVMTGAGQTLDLDAPVAVILLGVLGHVADTGQAHAIVRSLTDRMSPGSYLVLADSTDTDVAFARAQEQYNNSGSVPYTLRSPDTFRTFFRGLELVDPGVVTLPHWRPDLPAEDDAEIHELCGIARKPLASAVS